MLANGHQTSAGSPLRVFGSGQAAVAGAGARADSRDSPIPSAVPHPAGEAGRLRLRHLLLRSGRPRQSDRRPEPSSASRASRQLGRLRSGRHRQGLVDRRRGGVVLARRRRSASPGSAGAMSARWCRALRECLAEKRRFASKAAISGRTIRFTTPATRREARRRQLQTSTNSSTSTTARSRKSFEGNPEPQKKFWSRADDATLANPLGPPGRGWQEISQRLDHACSLLRDGEAYTVERVSAYSTEEVAWIVEMEHCRVKVAAAEEHSPSSLRVTTILRREDGEWKIAHRHADPITGAIPRVPDQK
jgi:ketosteroid isomerase-like protein